jgi:DNA-binding LacI/PurR family transcriptional regulator
VDYGLVPQPEWVHFFDPEDRLALRKELLSSGAQHLICGNDETAAALMGELEEIGVSVPEDLRIVGFDDIRYASMLKVPLTTLHQPATEIGDLAVETMLWRLENPTRPPRTVTAATAIIQRASCGVGTPDH